MQKRLEETVSAVAGKSRTILIDAAACFVATSLVAFIPHDWEGVETASLQNAASNIDPVSGKFLDRVSPAEVASQSEKNLSASTAYFVAFPDPRVPFEAQPTGVLASQKAAPAAAPARPMRESAKKHERTAEAKNSASSAASPPAPPATDAAPLPVEAKPEVPEDPDQNLFAKLGPTGLSSKLTPIGRTAWNGVTSLGRALVSGLSAYKF